jgi:two-component system, OmpR family, sensor kinase
VRNEKARVKTPARAHSLRARLVATVLVLLAVTLSVIGVATTLALRQFLYGRLDREVVEANDRFVAAQTGRLVPPGGFRYGIPPPEFLGPVQGPRTLGATIRDGVVQRAEVSSRGGGSSGVPDVDDAALLTVPVGGGPTTVDLSIGDYRMVATETAGTVYVIGQPAGGAQDVIARLVVVEVIAIGIALLGGGFAGAVLVRRELRPLERVADTAAKVSALPLDRGEVELAERVRDVDPRTEVGQVASALNQMLDNVGGALEARQDSEMRLRQFIADASHELRTPLAAIRGYAELTRRAPLAPEIEYSIARISSQTERMTTLVEDLLLLARLDAGRPLERGDVDLTRLVLDGVNDAYAAGMDHRWQLDLPDEPVVIPGDGPRLTQVLTNLLANARTHTPAGTTVTVGLARDEGGARLTVTDDGPGIAPDLLPHVFERFARGSVGRSRHTGSTGLGLAIVDAVVAAHGGTVTVASRPGRTEFAVRLPGDAASPAREVPGRTPAAASRTPSGAAPVLPVPAPHAPARHSR